MSNKEIPVCFIQTGIIHYRQFIFKENALILHKPYSGSEVSGVMW